MSNKLISVSFGPIRLSSQSATPQKSRTTQIAQSITACRNITLNLVVIFFIGALAWVTYFDLTQPKVILEEFELPEKLTDMGYSGTVASQRMWDAIVEIGESSVTNREKRLFLTEARLPEIVEPGSGLSMRSLANLLRSAFRIDEIRVAGEFVCTDPACKPEHLALRMRVLSRGGMRVISGGTISEQELDAYFHLSARKVIAEIDPYTLASFHYQQNDIAAAEAVALEIIDRGSKESAWAANLLGLIAGARGNTDTSKTWFYRSMDYAKIHGPDKFVLPHNNLAVLLMDRGNFPDARSAYEKAIALAPDSAEPYNGIGTSYHELKLFDEAISAFQKAIRMDAGYAEAKRNWGRTIARAIVNSDDRCAEIERLVPAYRRAVTEAEWISWVRRYIAETEEACTHSGPNSDDRGI